MLYPVLAGLIYLFPYRQLLTNSANIILDPNISFYLSYYFGLIYVTVFYVYILLLFILFCSHVVFAETEVTTTRPFGQPLCLVNENGDPPPSILKSTASVRKK